MAMQDKLKKLIQEFPFHEVENNYYERFYHTRRASEFLITDYFQEQSISHPESKYPNVKRGSVSKRIKNRENVDLEIATGAGYDGKDNKEKGKKTGRNKNRGEVMEFDAGRKNRDGEKESYSDSSSEKSSRSSKNSSRSSEKSSRSSDSESSEGSGKASGKNVLKSEQDEDRHHGDGKSKEIQNLGISNVRKESFSSESSKSSDRSQSSKSLETDQIGKIKGNNIEGKAINLDDASRDEELGQNRENFGGLKQNQKKNSDKSSSSSEDSDKDRICSDEVDESLEILKKNNPDNGESKTERFSFAETKDENSANLKTPQLENKKSSFGEVDKKFSSSSSYSSSDQEDQKINPNPIESKSPETSLSPNQHPPIILSTPTPQANEKKIESQSSPSSGSDSEPDSKQFDPPQLTKTTSKDSSPKIESTFPKVPKDSRSSSSKSSSKSSKSPKSSKSSSSSSRKNSPSPSPATSTPDNQAGKSKSSPLPAAPEEAAPKPVQSPNPPQASPSPSPEPHYQVPALSTTHKSSISKLDEQPGCCSKCLIL